MSENIESDVIMRAKQKQREQLEQYELARARRDFTAAIPTGDSEVRRRLRELGHPVCLFGEDAFGRRERLKLVVVTNGAVSSVATVASEATIPKQQDEVFYTHGSVDLLEARKMIYASSRGISNDRLERERSGGSKDSTEVSSYWGSQDVIASSQVGDVRPLTSIAFSPFSDRIGVAGWSGDINVFSDESLTQTVSLKGHIDRCCSIAWTPSGSTTVQLVSGGVDRTVRLWSLTGDSLSSAVSDGTSIPVIGALDVLEGHELRVNRVAIHPHHPQFVFSTSDDETWRLWDVGKKQELLLQEGHIGPVFAIAVHPDGSLVATSDTAGVIRVWDLRTGRSIMGFEGQHVDQIVGLDFSGNGFTMASCSGDNTVRIWDIRAKANSDILTAHEKLVSSVRFGGPRGDLLLTAGYDCVARVWRTCDFKIIKNLPLHETRIMAADFRQDGRAVATACYDRTFKIWKNSSKQDVKMEI